jgi:hypothetical protein
VPNHKRQTAKGQKSRKAQISGIEIEFCHLNILWRLEFWTFGIFPACAS